jgi:hypothetical protein
MMEMIMILSETCQMYCKRVQSSQEEETIEDILNDLDQDFSYCWRFQ